MYGLITTKRPVRAKALIINAFALTGRFVVWGTFTQGVALGYVLLPLRGVLLWLSTHPIYLLSQATARTPLPPFY